MVSELGFPLESLYRMTKGACLQLARTISAEYRDQGIRCNAVVFLASDEASFISGNALYVDNGWYAKG